MKKILINKVSSRPNYRFLLPRKIYWAGIFMETIQFFGMCWLMIAKAPWLGLLSSFGLVVGFLILKPHYEGDSLRDSWKLSCFTSSLSMMMIQLILTATGPIL